MAIKLHILNFLKDFVWVAKSFFYAIISLVYILNLRIIKDNITMNYVYMLKCIDNTYYIGWTNNIKKRLAAHNSNSSGAKYTRSRRPVTLVYCEGHESKSSAMKREYELKKLSKIQKNNLVDSINCGERLTIYDANENPCGNLPRSMVHALGLRHHVCHLWLIEEKNGVIGMWLQQRAKNRPLNPSMYDLAATGHIDPLETPLNAVLREACEEIGVKFDKNSIAVLGTTEQTYPRQDGGFDDELVYAFAVRVDNEPDFNIGSEVQRMVWISFSEFAKLEQGEAFAQTSAGIIKSNEVCCIGKGEWQAFEKHLKFNEKKC